MRPPLSLDHFGWVVLANVEIEMGQANEKIARVQDAYVASASESWLESIERSLAQMKEYQVAKLRTRSTNASLTFLPPGRSQEA